MNTKSGASKLIDATWDALRLAKCSSKLEATTVVLLRKKDLAEAIKKVLKETNDVLNTTY